MSCEDLDIYVQSGEFVPGDSSLSGLSGVMSCGIWSWRVLSKNLTTIQLIVSSLFCRGWPSQIDHGTGGVLSSGIFLLCQYSDAVIVVCQV